jgi:hypothetical protein
MLIGLIGLVVIGGGMRLLASEGSGVVAGDGTPHAPAGVTPVPNADPSDDPKQVEHPRGPGSKRDPFEPVIKVGGGDGDAPASEPTGEPTSDTEVTIRLDDIYPDSKGRLVALLELDGTKFRAKQGVTAADLVTVVQLTDRCGTFEQGGDRFALCVGQAIERTR